MLKEWWGYIKRTQEPSWMGSQWPNNDSNWLQPPQWNRNLWVSTDINTWILGKAINQRPWACLHIYVQYARLWSQFMWAISQGCVYSKPPSGMRWCPNPWQRAGLLPPAMKVVNPQSSVLLPYSTTHCTCRNPSRPTCVIPVGLGGHKKLMQIKWSSCSLLRHE